MKILFTKKIPAEQLSELLERGVAVEIIEVIQIETVKTDNFDFENKSLIFSSVNSAQAFLKNGFKIEKNQSGNQKNRIYCVGEKAADFLQKKFNVQIEYIAPNAADLSDFIINKHSNKEFLHFCGDLALDILEEKLTENNIQYQKAVVYKTVLLFPKIEENYQAVVFFSPSGVRSFAKHNSMEDFLLFSIGETTSAELRKYTENTIFTSRKNTLQDVVQLIKKNI